MDTYLVQFRKMYFKRLKGYGKFRSNGRIEFYADGIQICGKHVYSLAARLGIGAAIFLGALIVSCGSLAPGILPLYFLMEYGILKTENIFVPFNQIISYTSHPDGLHVGIDFLGKSHASPVVMKSNQSLEIYTRLYEKMPEREAQAMMIPGYSVQYALTGAVVSFAGIFIISDFVLAFFGLITEAMPTFEGIMLLSELLLFLGSIGVAILYYKKKRASMPPVPIPTSYGYNTQAAPIAPVLQTASNESSDLSVSDSIQ